MHATACLPATRPAVQLLAARHRCLTSHAALQVPPLAQLEAGEPGPQLLHQHSTSALAPGNVVVLAHSSYGPGEQLQQLGVLAGSRTS